MTENNKNTSKGKILAVDDKQENLYVLIKILDKQGYDVFPAISGVKALSAVRSNKPDLILLDILMPDMNGYEVCKHLKADEQTRDIPIIFISALSETVDKVKAFSIGGVDYISKPFEVKEVLARIETHLSLQRLQKSIEEKNELLEQEILARKRAEEAAQMANQAKSAFLANMSHELRTPLNAILGFAELMSRSQRLDSENKENLAIISRSGKHLLTLINQVLDFSKIEAGRTTINESKFDLYALLNDLEDMFSLKANDKDLQLIFDHYLNFPQYIIADEVKLRQILINLLNNALKFTQKGGVTVRVREKPIFDKKVLFHFKIEDTGPGIPPDELTMLFEAFVQTSTGRETGEGTGLGLAISHQFVQLMGGELTVSSQFGQGTTFEFSLPCQLAEAIDVKNTRIEKEVIALEPNQSSYRILIVDDNWTNRQLLIKLLNPLGFELREAENGKEAIEIWEKWEPHLIWMDMQMPVMDGFEATRQIKAHTKGQATIIIILTASVLEEERVVIFDAGCDDFLRKPFKNADIFYFMHKHIGVRYLYEEESKPNGDEEITITELKSEMLTLPDVLLKKWQEAVENGDLQTALSLIDRIGENNKSLANTLSKLAKDFRFDILQEVFDE
ncbi:MAG: response regulator [Thiomargarita sp.]|nr:response regulator [Thiomargarita sp.]